LRHRNARLFFAGLLVSNIGTWLQLTAMSLLVYRLTGRATDLGITVGLQFVPMLVLGAWAGAVADRHDKRTLAIVTQVMLAAQAIVLGVIDLAGLASVPVVWSLVLVLGIVNAFETGSPRAGHRARRAAGHHQRHVTQHGGDDGLAHLRPRPRRADGRHRRDGMVLPVERPVVRCRARVAAARAAFRAAPATTSRPRRSAGA